MGGYGLRMLDVGLEVGAAAQVCRSAFHVRHPLHAGAHVRRLGCIPLQRSGRHDDDGEQGGAISPRR